MTHFSVESEDNRKVTKAKERQSSLIYFRGERATQTDIFKKCGLLFHSVTEETGEGEHFTVIFCWRN